MSRLICISGGHLHNLLIVGKSHLFILIFKHIQSGCPFHCQRMHRDTVWIQSGHFFHGMFHLFILLPRKPYDQVHINIIKSKFSGQMKCFHSLFYRVSSSDDIQSTLIHSLWIDGNSADPMFSQHFQLFSGNTVRPSRFHGKLLQITAVKAFLYLCQQTIHLIWFQGSWCSSSHIDRIQFAVAVDSGTGFDFFTKRIQIRIHFILPYRKWAGTKRTIQTDARTKRNADIQAVSIFIIDVF